MFAIDALCGMAAEAAKAHAAFEASAGIDGEEAVASSPVFNEFAALMRGEERATGTVPASFADEVFDPSWLGEARSASDGTVLGFVTTRSADEVSARCAGDMSAKGWTRVQSGRVDSASFVKETGRYRWAYLDCLTVDDATSVTVIVKEDGG